MSVYLRNLFIVIVHHMAITAIGTQTSANRIQWKLKAMVERNALNLENQIQDSNGLWPGSSPAGPRHLQDASYKEKLILSGNLINDGESPVTRNSQRKTPNGQFLHTGDTGPNTADDADLLFRVRRTTIFEQELLNLGFPMPKVRSIVIKLGCVSMAALHNYLCNTDSNKYGLQQYKHLVCTVNGSWSGWSAWTNFTICSVTCGGGGTWTRNRTRSCDNPAPSNGGTNCTGESGQTESEICGNVSCPVDGSWSGWSAWTNFTICSVTCGGGGTRTRNRTMSCDNPAPANGGTNCTGESGQTESEICCNVSCPVDGSWSEWSVWANFTDCSATCGGAGTQTKNRTRNCDTPAPANGGANCTGETQQTESEICGNVSCPVDGSWSVWSAWINFTDCSVTCGGGTRTRYSTRSCDNPTPVNGGTNCTGEFAQTENEICGNVSCPVAGSWSEWSAWTNFTACSATCGGAGTRTKNRTRNCDTPAPANGGANCTGETQQRESEICGNVSCPVDGSWSVWSAWINFTDCSVTCGGGTRTRYSTRSCDNPTPVNGGTNCTGEFAQTENEICGNVSCPVAGSWSEWSAWTNFTACSATCGGAGTRTKNRTRNCDTPAPANGGDNCPGETQQAEREICGNVSCPVDGSWSGWSAWTNFTICSVTCGGGGTRTRNRTMSCDNPAPANRGTNCTGESGQTESEICGNVSCPVDGSWSEWSVWANFTDCSATCGGAGTRTKNRTRNCDTPTPANGGANCTGETQQTESEICGNLSCPVDGSWSVWSAWINFTDCSVTCGGGTRTRYSTRSCDNPTPVNGGTNCTGEFAQTENEICGNVSCPVAGFWSEWSAWTNITACSATCGGAGTRTKNRTRNCDTPAPTNGGDNCPGETQQAEHEICGNVSCPVDGSWSGWSAWTNFTICSVTCGGGGTRTRNRTMSCDNPAPANGGTNCTGESGQTESEICGNVSCPVDGSWSEWSVWANFTDCSATCGGAGTRSKNRTRNCDTPTPANGGANCTGETQQTESEICGNISCPVDGSWSVWSAWTNFTHCSVTCGGGTRTRYSTRSCDNPTPVNGGTNCTGEFAQTENEICGNVSCPVAGSWSEWSAWTNFTACSATCGGAGTRTKNRTRNCDTPAPANGGYNCPGETQQAEHEICGNVSCPVDGSWSGWSAWTNFTICSVTCGGGGTRTRNRTMSCDNPAPANGGTNCTGESGQTESEICGNVSCPVDGSWSEWSVWANFTDCSATCGGAGTRTKNRTRNCDTPTPANGGANCTGETQQTESEICGNISCPVDGSWSVWSAWTNFTHCSVTCGGGTRTRYSTRSCDNPTPVNGGTNCTGEFAQTENEICGNVSCPVAGSWSEWSAWTNFTACSATCGGAGTRTKNRTRNCDTPAPANGGYNCPGETQQAEHEICGNVSCPVDGSWSGWSAWTNFTICSVTCGGGGTRTRNRTMSCDNPAPANGGTNCTGESGQTESEICGNVSCPVDGSWSEWSVWANFTDCSATCGGAGTRTKNRTRNCDTPTPANGGANCTGETQQTESEICGNISCPVDGSWSVWSAWSNFTDCSVTCGGGTRTRYSTRSCDNPTPVNGGTNCTGEFAQTENEICGNVSCPVAGSWSEWSAWTNFTACSATCGGAGTRTKNRTRNCDTPAPANGGYNCPGETQQAEHEICGNVSCPVDGSWSGWSAWTNFTICSVTCGGGGTRTRNRTMSCDNPALANGGTNCTGESGQTESEICGNVSCPVDGSWSEWSVWANFTDCSATCGGAGTRTKNRTRNCDTPTPANGGANCTGETQQTESEICGNLSCPVDGSWSVWSAWINFTDCSVTCGGGTRTRYSTRSCDNPTPINGGTNCTGEFAQTENEICGNVSCPVAGSWSEWSAWTNFTACSATCGSAGTRTKNRTRNCDTPAPANGGDNCPGETQQAEHEICGNVSCPVDGSWSGWSAWTNFTICSVTCGGGGTRTRNRTMSCDNPAPANRGTNCTGESGQTESEICGNVSCPVDGSWSEWSVWANFTDCSATCGGAGTRTKNRTRNCDTPAPANGGDNCPGETQQAEHEICGNVCCPVDGSWSIWSGWTNFTDCTVTCGGSTRTRNRTRSCNNPAPLNGGINCTGESAQTESEICGNCSCPEDGSWSGWSAWTNFIDCSVTCGGGTRTRSRNRSCNNPAPFNGGTNCTGESAHTESDICGNVSCPVDGSWSEWSAWTNFTDCSATCGGAGTRTKNRTRNCDTPAPANGGANCTGETQQTESEICGNVSCPVVYNVVQIGGDWGQWSDWGVFGPCSATCSGGGYQIRSRHRRCNNPLSEGNNSFCNGTALETQRASCETVGCRAACMWGQYSCLDGVTCIESTLTCDHKLDCPQGEDEAECNSGTRTRITWVVLLFIIRLWTS